MLGLQSRLLTRISVGYVRSTGYYSSKQFSQTTRYGTTRYLMKPDGSVQRQLKPVKCLKAAVNHRMKTTGTNQTKTPNLSKEEEAQAERMFQELNALVEKRRLKELANPQKTWGQSISQFFKQSKHQLINIGAAFACLIFAIQLTEARMALKKKKEAMEIIEQEMQKLEERIEFVRGVEFAKFIVDELQSRNVDESNPKASIGWLSRLWSSPTTSESDEQFSMREETQILVELFQRHMDRVFGDLEISQANKEMKEIAMYQSLAADLAGDAVKDALHPAAEQIALAADAADEQTNEDLSDGITITKKRKIMF